MIDVPAFGRRPKIKKQDLDSSRVLQQAFKVCPGAGLSCSLDTLNHSRLIKSLIQDWGPIFEIWEGYAANRDIRFQSSSGGAISALSLYCLEHEKMHGVLHTAANAKRPYLNETVMSKTRASIINAAGSRYSPASPCEKLQEIEDAPSPCVFIGKPCDVAAVANVKKVKPELDKKIGLTIACFCAGTPSTNGTLTMIKQMGFKSPADLSTLRYRGCGWPGKTVAESNIEGESMRRNLTYEQSWGKILQKYRQWRCYICPDHTGEFADIAVGDPWHRNTKNDSQGKSLILARTSKGQEIIKKAITAGYLIAEQVKPDTLPASQPNLLKAQSRLWGQLIGLKIAYAPYPVYKGFNLASSWLHNLTLQEKVNSILGTFKRIYTKKIKKRQRITYDDAQSTSMDL
ncbi:Coenzyme F420 hydrogenase/dehydrogenase, beta subunit C-terminal domain [Candidatus Pacearchaeota archaeon]|nr:Coenzyme F420 hydrogenase/dehydrogenase, beta subunit C-terminal domain [Candidatus Pacearchaeota archaeon]